MLRGRRGRPGRGAQGDPRPLNRATIPGHCPRFLAASGAVPFETSEPLAQVRDRLVAAGHLARLVEGPGRAVHVADPDGQEIQIHELS
ncbi:hypothetical protein EDD41_3017 [Luteococcus japonicus]|uniref:Glyoxalase-like domain-containing protein n=1 Tax=Luteococcus japonicus TaxID=33984 RepID=A0A3N1ZZ16_9ACTN|nr:hypothetical protein EDD41_3017 [Luteococcus japonicus]